MLDLATKLRPWSLLRSLRARATELGQGARTKPNGRARIGAPYDDIDDEFHAAYGRARLTIERDIPVFVVLADELVFLHRGERKSWSFSPPGYHLIKAISHAPLALFSSLQTRDAAVRLEDAIGRRATLRQWLARARDQLEAQAPDLPREVLTDLTTVLTATAEQLGGTEQRVDHDAVTAFARALGPALLRLIDAATELQLEALHAHVEEALGELDAEATRRLEVVITGNHQARVRSLPMQYFKRRLRESETHDGRVAYAEGVDNERDALALVGTRRLDRAISAAFFGEPSRMQRDLLGDAARARLDGSNIAPLGENA